MFWKLSLLHHEAIKSSELRVIDIIPSNSEAFIAPFKDFQNILINYYLYCNLSVNRKKSGAFLRRLIVLILLNLV